MPLDKDAAGKAGQIVKRLETLYAESDRLHEEHRQALIDVEALERELGELVEPGDYAMATGTILRVWMEGTRKVVQVTKAEIIG